MAIEYKDKTVLVTGKVFEKELLGLKEFMDSHKNPLTIDLSSCDDLHGSLVQLLLAFKAVHGCEFIYSDKVSTYKKALEGFRTVEDDCNK